jgi:hypothetical protein
MRTKKEILDRAKDLDFAKAFKKALKKIKVNSNFMKINKKGMKQGFYFRVQGYSIQLAKWLKIKPEKLINLLNLSVEYKIALIRGYFDGDGTLQRYEGKRKKLVAVITGKNRFMMIILRELVSDIGFKNSIYKCDNSKGWSGVLYQLWIRGSSEETSRFISVIKPNIKRKSIWR